MTTRCSSCGMKILDSSKLIKYSIETEAEKQELNFHPNCFKCTKCTKKFESVEESNRVPNRFDIVCKSCLDVITNEKAEETKKSPHEKLKSQQAIASKIEANRELLNCAKCSKVVYLAEKLDVHIRDKRRTFHKACFRCVDCSVQLDVNNFGSLQEVIYCNTHLLQHQPQMAKQDYFLSPLKSPNTFAATENVYESPKPDPRDDTKKELNKSSEIKEVDSKVQTSKSSTDTSDLEDRRRLRQEREKERERIAAEEQKQRDDELAKKREEREKRLKELSTESNSSITSGNSEEEERERRVKEREERRKQREAERKREEEEEARALEQRRKEREARRQALSTS